MSIEWETPPPRRGHARNGRMVRFVEELAKRPGEWGIYRRDARTATARAGIDKVATARGLDIEATSRSNGDGTHTIYARVTGKASS